jgi:hypothetical protein
MPTKKTFATLGCALALLGVTLASAHETAPADSTAPAAAAPANAPAGSAPTVADRVAAIKASLAQSATNLKAYTRTETQVVNYKGEDKPAKQFTCSYGADGKVVKTLVTPAATEDEKRGLRKKVIENKKEEMADYLQSAAALIKSYIPPDPAKIEAAKAAGKVSMTPMANGAQVKVDIKDYEKPGDDLGIVVDMTTNRIAGLSVASYLTDAADAVTLNVTMAALPDGTGYAGTTVLDGVAKQIKITTTNSGYTKTVN